MCGLLRCQRCSWISDSVKWFYHCCTVPQWQITACLCHFYAETELPVVAVCAHQWVEYQTVPFMEWFVSVEPVRLSVCLGYLIEHLPCCHCACSKLDFLTSFTRFPEWIIKVIGLMVFCDGDSSSRDFRLSPHLFFFFFSHLKSKVLALLQYSGRKCSQLVNKQTLCLFAIASCKFCVLLLRDFFMNFPLQFSSDPQRTHVALWVSLEMNHTLKSDSYLSMAHSWAVCLFIYFSFCGVKSTENVEKVK